MKPHLTKAFRYLRDKLYQFLEFIRFAFIPRNKKFSFVLITVVCLAVFVFGGIAYATPQSESPKMAATSTMGTTILGFVNHLLFLIAYALGWVAMKVFALVIWVASYNDIVTSPAVTKGWVLLRDTCNMFFVVILLVIAFSQILGVQKYSLKSMLPKVVLAAVLVNFSKLICGLIIDFGQVVMLTFVNGFKATAGANLLVGLGLTRLLKMNADATSDNPTTAASGPAASEITLALVLAIFMIICVIFVSFFIAVMLVMRIVTLWILVVTSPLAFMLNIMPFSSGHYSKWWGEFGNNVAVGPVLAFFLWLSLLIMSNPDEMMPNSSGADKALAEKAGENGKTGEASAMSYTGNMAQFAIALSMLLAGLKMAQEVGGAVGAVAGKAQQWGSAAAKGAAYRMTGAKAIVDRGAAIGAGWKAQSQEKQKMKMAAYGRFGTRAFGVKEKAVSTTFKAAPGSLAVAKGLIVGKGGGGKAYADARAAAKLAGKGRFGGVMAGMKAGTKATVQSTFSSSLKERGAAAAGGWEHERKFGRFGATGAIMAAGAKQAANKSRLEDAEKKSIALGTNNKADRKTLAESRIAPKGDRINAELGRAKNGEFANMAEANRARATVKGDKGAEGALSDELKKNQAHLAYDLNTKEGKDKFAEAVKNKEIDPSGQRVEAYMDPDFMNELQKVLGGKNFAKKMEDVANRSADHKEAVSAGMVGGTVGGKSVVGVMPTLHKELSDLNGIPTRTPEQEARKIEIETRMPDLKKAVAGVTGDLAKAFASRDASGQVVRNAAGHASFTPAEETDLKNYTRKASGKDLAGAELEPVGSASVQHIATTVNLNQLTQMATSSETNAVDNTNTLVRQIVRNVTAAVAASGAAPGTPAHAALIAQLGKIATNVKIVGALNPTTIGEMTTLGVTVP